MNTFNKTVLPTLGAALVLFVGMIVASPSVQASNVDSSRSGVWHYPASSPTAGGCGTQVLTPPGLFLPLGRVSAAANMQVEPTIAVSPVNPSLGAAAWIDYRTGSASVGYAYTYDGGFNWVYGGQLPLQDGQPYAGDPCVVADPDDQNKYYMVFICFNDNPPPISSSGVYFAKSTNAGQSWSSITHLEGDANNFVDKPWIAIDRSNTPQRGRLYAVWGNYSISAPGIKLQYSSDRGSSWTATQTTLAAGQGNWLTPMVTTGPQGQVYVSWHGFYLGNTLWLARSTNGGLSFPYVTMVQSMDYFAGNSSNAIARINNNPAIACNPVTGHIYLAWNNRKFFDGGGQGSDVFFIRSSDQGASWGARVNVFTSTSGSSMSEQFFPAISVNDAGTRVNVLFYDTSEDPNGLQCVPKIATAVEHGAGFLPSIAITGWRSCPRQVGFFGDYIGMVSVGGKMFPIWVDTRPEVPDEPPAIYASRVDENDVHLLGLNTIAGSNKSASSSASWNNSARQLAKGLAARLHEVFTSGGEIFCRRQYNSTWEITKQVSSGNDYNSLPSITVAHDYSLHIVWQRLNPSTNKYEVWYSRSTDNGVSWTTPAILPGAGAIIVSSNQLSTYPVVAEWSSGSNYQIIVLFVTSVWVNGGLQYQKSTNNGSSWLAAPVCIPSTAKSPAYNGFIWYLSLAKGSNFLALSYDYRVDNPTLYSRRYDGTTWTAEQNVNVATGTTYDRHSSVAVDNGGRTVVAWDAGKTGESEYRILFRQSNLDGTWSGSWFVEFTRTIGISNMYPSISYYNRGGGDPYGMNIVYHRTNLQVNQKTYSGGAWQDCGLSTSGQWPSVSLENSSSGNPVKMWTSQAPSPYDVQLSSTLCASKVSATVYEHHRRAVLQDLDTYSSLSLEMGEVKILTLDGDTIPVPFKRHLIDEPIQVDLTSIWDYVGTEAISLPVNAKWLIYEPDVRVETLQDSTGKVGVNSFTDYSSNVTLRDVNAGTTLSSTTITTSSGKTKSDIASFAGRTIVVCPTVIVPPKLASNLAIGLGDVYVEKQMALKSGSDLVASAKPGFTLSQNYPNPFNPVTTFKYELATNAYVMLLVYNPLGQEVAQLVDAYQEAGHHSIGWNAATSASSGLYFARMVVRDENGRNLYMETKKVLLMK